MKSNKKKQICSSNRCHLKQKEKFRKIKFLCYADVEKSHVIALNEYASNRVRSI